MKVIFETTQKKGTNITHSEKNAPPQKKNKHGFQNKN